MMLLCSSECCLNTLYSSNDFNRICVCGCRFGGTYLSATGVFAIFGLRLVDVARVDGGHTRLRRIVFDLHLSRAAFF